MSLLQKIKKDPATIADLIEHTNIRVTSTSRSIEKLCREVLRYGFHAACVLPYHAKLAKEILGGKAKVVTVIGFPYGVQCTKAKLAEAKAVLRYVDEFDVVMNRIAFRNEDYEVVVKDIKSIVEAVSPKEVKVIIETPTLTTKQIKIASKLVMQSKAHFVKTAVGYKGPAKPEEVRTIKGVVGEKLGIKASGGIRTFKQAMDMIKAGATRIGTSSGVEIMKTIPKLAEGLSYF